MRPLKKEGTHVYLNLTELHFTIEIHVQRKKQRQNISTEY